jgi:AraC family transcriptional regulator
MESVRKALWFAESRFRGEVSLDELSVVAGLSRYHFAHVFARATGQSAMRYTRGRRLSEAARVLANGGPDILTVALDFGYGSHEAFTRAFRDQFGVTPESVRAQRHLDNVNLVEAIKMDDGLTTTLAPPRIEQGRLLLIAGTWRKVFSRYPPKHSGFVAALAVPSRQRPWASFWRGRRQRGADVWRLLQHGR